MVARRDHIADGFAAYTLPPIVRVSAWTKGADVVGRLGRVLVAVGTSIVLAGACSGPGGADRGGSSGQAPGDSSLSAQSLVEQVVALDRDALEALLRAEAPALELQALIDVGLAEAAGGEQQLRGAYQSLVEATREAAAWSSTVAAGRYSAPIPVTGESSGLGAMMMLPVTVTYASAPGVVGLGNGMEPGSAPSSLPNDSQFGSSVVTASHGSGALEASVNVTGTGAGYTGKATMKTQPCPTPDGQITTSGQWDSRLSVGTDATGLNLTIDYEIVAHVDDDARITNTDVEVRVQGASFQDRKGGYIDQTIRFSRTGATFTSESASVNRQGGSLTQAQADGWARLALSQVLVLEQTLLPELQKALESGRCVQVTADPARESGVTPSTPIDIAVTARSKVDGAPAGGTIRARLEGGTSVDPAGQKVPADATFAYIAPAEVGRTAEVFFEARSKRGVGKGSAYFGTNVKGWRVEAPWGVFELRGPICDPAEPFSLTAASPDGDLELAFIPTDESSGSLTMTGTYSESTITGAGTYTLKLDEASGSLKMKTAGEGTISGFTVPSFVGTYEIPITATDFC